MKPEEVDLKEKPVEAIGLLNAVENLFFITSDNINLFVQQPRQRHLPAMREARAKIDPKSWARYAPYSTIWDDLSQAVNLPLFKMRSIGTLYMIMTIDEEVVGFSSHEYRGTGAGRHVVGGLCLTAPWRGRGVGSLYSKLSVYIAVFQGARSFHGQTRIDGGMYNIRMRDGWITERVFDHKGNMMATIKKVLPESRMEIRNMLIGEGKSESSNN